MRAPLPENEAERLRQLESLGLLYSPAHESFDRLTRLAQEMFNVPTVLVSLVAKDVQWFKSAAGTDVTETSRDVSFCAHAIHDAKAYVVDDTHQNPIFADNPLVTGPPHIRFYAGQPIENGGQRIGTLCLIDNKPRTMSERDLDLLESLGHMVETEIRLAASMHRNVELGKAAMTDPLTDVWNRRGFENLLFAEIDRSVRNQMKYVVVLIDLDDFKRINDQYGYTEGDKALSLAAEILKSVTRAPDIVSRFGGDEFLILLSQCDDAQASLVAERILEGLERANHQPQISFSVGMSPSSGLNAESFTRMFEEANQALQEAKHSGKNCYKQFRR